MYYISYQGIYDGSDYQNANTPAQVSKAQSAGFSCLVDVWRINNKLYMGNRQPLIEVTEKYIQGPRFWINAKNQAMQDWLATQSDKLYPNYFWFETPTPPPPYVTASNGKLITPGTVPINENSVIFLPEIDDQSLYSTTKLRCYGVISCFLLTIRRMRNEGYGAWI
jgi:hypothetical protein